MIQRRSPVTQCPCLNNVNRRAQITVEVPQSMMLYIQELFLPSLVKKIIQFLMGRCTFKRSLQNRSSLWTTFDPMVIIYLYATLVEGTNQCYTKICEKVKVANFYLVSLTYSCNRHKSFTQLWYRFITGPFLSILVKIHKHLQQFRSR